MTQTKPLTTSTEELDSILERSRGVAREWAGWAPADRARVLTAVADALAAGVDTLVPIAMRETHLPEPRLRGELARTVFQLRLFAEVLHSGDHLEVTIDHADPEWPMGAPRPDLRLMQIPLGPVVVFSGSNFPFAFSVAGGDTASALAAGCPVIVKAHSGHLDLSVATAAIVLDALRESGAPEGVFALIIGQDAGRDAVLDPRVAAGAFTGSLHGGRALFDLANSRPTPIPFYAEMGSTNPVFVTQAAAAKRSADIATGFIGSYTLGAGQFCTKPGVLIVPEESDLLTELANRPLPAAAPLLNDRIQSGYAESLAELLERPASSALRLDDDAYAGPPSPALIQTTVEDVRKDPEILMAEVFGPTALVVTYRDEADLVGLAESLEGQLTASIFGEVDDEIVGELAGVLVEKVGRLLWNQWSTGVSVTYSQQHGGPYPATSAPSTTSVGTAAIKRFLRPIAFQGFPEQILPDSLKDDNPLGLNRRVDGKLSLSE